MLIHVIDGTYELFRHYYALPSARDEDGREVAAVRGVLASIRGMLAGGATHVGVATDHVIESFRNGLWPGYKTGEGIDPDAARAVPAARRGARRRRDRRVADGRVRSRRRAGAAAASGGRRSARGARDHLHARQRPRAVRARHARRAAQPPHAHVLRRSRRRREVRRARPRASPTIWRWSATRRTASRDCPAGARNRPPPCSRNSATSKRSRRTRATGTSTSRAPRRLAQTLQRDRERALLFRDARDAAHRYRTVRRRRNAALEWSHQRFADDGTGTLTGRGKPGCRDDQQWRTVQRRNAGFGSTVIAPQMPAR